MVHIEIEVRRLEVAYQCAGTQQINIKIDSSCTAVTVTQDAPYIRRHILVLHVLVYCLVALEYLEYILWGVQKQLS